MTRFRLAQLYQSWRNQAVATALCASAAVYHPLEAGQVTLDGSFGTRGPLTGPNFAIPARVGKTVGNNLFHSFGQFDLSKGDTATFSGGSNIRNILSRVTGGTLSSIDGTIQSTIDGANVFFINPSGVVIGPNAHLDVTGSFVVTTADHIKLADGGRFDATSPANDLLTTAPPRAFGFLAPKPAAITFQGPGGQFPPPTLEVSEGKTIAMVGGDIRIVNGQLTAPAGRVALVGVASSGDVVLDVDAPVSSIDTASLARLGDVTLSDFAFIDVSGTTGGRVFIGAQNFLMENVAEISSFNFGPSEGLGVELHIRDSLTVRNGADIISVALDTGKGGGVQIEAASVLLSDGASITTDTGGPGDSGDVIVRAGSLDLRNNASITVGTGGSGSGGNIDVVADSIRLDGGGALAALFSIGGEGKPGNIHLKAETVELKNFARISTQTEGTADGGNIVIEAQSLVAAGNSRIDASTDNSGTGGSIHVTSNSLVLDGAGTLSGIFAESLGGSGNGGDIDLETHSLDVRQGARISASTSGPGNGGSIQVTADSITLSEGLETFTGLQAQTTGSGRGGDVEVTAGSFEMSNGAEISVETTGTGAGGNVEIQADAVRLSSSSRISANTIGLGNGGSIHISGDLVRLDGRNQDGSPGVADITAGNNSGLQGDAPAGSITIDAGSLDVLHGAAISTSTKGGSSGGSVILEADRSIRVVDHSSVTATATQNGGNLTLKANGVVYFLDSSLSAEATSGNGGNITIEPPFVVLNHSTVNASSVGANGGSITIQSEGFLESESVLSATGVKNGIIEIESPEIDLTSSLVVLNGSFLSAEAQLRPQCSVRLPGGISSFIVTGRGGLPIEPDWFSPSFDW